MVRRLLAGMVFGCTIVGAVSAAPCPTTGPNLTLTNTTCQLSGQYTFGTITLTNSTIEVVAYNNVNKVTTGNLELKANTITIDATSKITAKGSGYSTLLCGNGRGPTTTAAGRGGCSLRDSGGGGAHFGNGGRGTIDNPPSFPAGYEEDCSAPAATPASAGGLGILTTYNSSGVALCALPSAPTVRANANTSCRSGNDGLPTVAGRSYWHSIYQPEFGASGGDKGCLDGDGYDPSNSGGIIVGGAGGGRIVLAAVNGAQTGQLTLNGTLDANGKRGCGIGNDSGGGGAGGTVLVVGDRVTIGATARVTAAGGLGGDTQGLATDPTGECAAPAQQNTTADDCGGGGGGGIVSVLSGISALIDDRAKFDVNGAAGGVSSLCRGEAGGGVGELQISGGYVGEFCDGFDNDFNGMVDDLPPIDCGGSTIMACVGGVPQQCAPNVPTCQGPVTDSRARFTVVVDTSGSMLADLAGIPTFGDGSMDHPGLDHNSNGRADDSRLFKAKTALTNVISAYPNIDFALARYHQDQSLDRSCQTAHNFECNALCCSYDNPTNNTAPAATPACSVVGANGAMVTVNTQSPANEECINYAGNCGPPRRGADVVVGFGASVNNYLMWLDGTETNFNNTQTVGEYCNFAGGGNCELRGTGPTPLANSLQAVEDYLAPIKACDIASVGGCRRYGVILLTDGAESCQGDPVAAAASLRAKGIDTFVIGFSTLPSETTQLNAIAAAGGTSTAFLVGNDDQLANALATIVSGSIVFETCNNLDDDCDGNVDEDFPAKGLACDNGALGACRGTGTLGCTADGAGLQCNITMPGASPMPETCNGLDDNCNGAIDEGISCTPGCVPTSTVDLCNGLDDDCDGAFEEDDGQVGQPCGMSDVAPCKFGVNACIGGNIVCVGAIDPQTEVCNGIDDNCDGMPDVDAPCPSPTSCVEGGCRVRCAGGEFPCPAGFRCSTTPGGDFCVPSACANCAPNEICQNEQCIDPCANVQCGPLEECRFGTCIDCNSFGCPAGKVCLQSMCVADPCSSVDCGTSCDNPLGCSCNDGQCVDNCDDTKCPTGQRCSLNGGCVADVCANVECEAGRCVDGECVEDPCGSITCRAGQVCYDGACIEDPCKLVACTGPFHCEVRDGGGLCVPDHPAGRPDLVQAGGGGCAAGGSGAGWLVLVGVGLAATGLRRRRLAVAVATLGLAACGLNPYDLNRSTAGDGGIGDGGDGDGGTGSDGGPTCVPIGIDDQCNEIDDDCDGIVDNNFNKQTNTNHCGTCNRRCIGTGAVQGCVAGQCVFVECQPGFADLDADPLTCEYQCPLFPTLAEECNGVDDDCDGIVDEDLPAPPTGQCRVTPNTPCAGTQMVCEKRGTETRWWCDYGPDVEFDPTIPNGIVLAEQLCDGKDGDCDGLADNTFTDLGQECDNGGLGVCRDVGARICDPITPTQTMCDLSVLPDAQAPTMETCDGLDNNCDGVVDNASGPNRVVDAMVQIGAGASAYWIDAYEASRPDATAMTTGVSSARSCSKPGVIPWRGATFASAQAACVAAGKVLCSSSRWQTACAGSANNAYPYGASFNPNSCNTETYDGIPGGANDNVAIATGAAAACTTTLGVFDMSGNLKEWTDDITGTTSGGTNIAVQRGGSYQSPSAAATCDFRLTRAAVTAIEQETGFRCCRATAP